ncbi:MAG: DUF4302 domain-containing protein [Muribaculaceae bacterium]|nr:DUF4302 domain-containing protein [Muribaculaceae bacterium]
MKKSIYLATLAALALTACSSDNDGIFDQSAADRLEQYKKDYAEVLTENGGLWTMEYFSNADEPGYVFVMKFDKNGSVEISANHKWIGGEFKQETSLWKMIADNGPVLSFNSYNNLFHIFSDPANITGPDAPTGDFGDIDETGFGHEGDYEFQVMEVSDNGQTVRLLGKKTLYDIYLHRLDPATDVNKYLDDVKEVPNRFTQKFNNLTMTDEEGNLYRVYDMMTAIPSVYPLDGDAVSQTVSANGIFTLTGFRFMKPLEVKKANDSTFELTELFFNDDFTMYGENIADMRALSPLENLVRADLTWTLDPESMTGKFKELYDAANVALVAHLTNKDKLGNIDFAYGSNAGKLVPQFVTRIGTRVCRDYIEYDAEYSENGDVVPSNDLHFTVTGGNNTSIKYNGEVPAYKAFKDYFSGNFVMTVNDPINPDVITLTDKNDPSSHVDFRAK